MIDFQLTEQQKQLREFLHWFAEHEMRPISLQCDETHETPLDFLQKVRQYGLSMDAVPRSGKSEQGEAEETGRRRLRETNRLGMIAAEELAWGDAALILNFPGPGLGGPPVRFIGTPEQRQRFLSVFEAEEPRWGAYGLTEPEAGSDVAGIRTTAKKDGEHYVLNGSKCYITNGAKASWVVIFATVDRSLGRAGHRAFVVEKGWPGFKVARINPKMGLRASETADLILEDCRVPVDNLLGGEAHYEKRGAEGFKVAMQTFDSTRPMVAAMAIGIARAAFEKARQWAEETTLPGSPSPSTVRLFDRLEEMRRRIEAGRLLCWKAAFLADAGIPNSKEASMAKAYCGYWATWICSEAVAIMGPEGVRREPLVEKWFRDIKVYDIFEGTGQIQRLIVSRRLFEAIGSAG